MGVILLIVADKGTVVRVHLIRHYQPLTFCDSVT